MRTTRIQQIELSIYRHGQTLMRVYRVYFEKERFGEAQSLKKKKSKESYYAWVMDSHIRVTKPLL